MSTSCTAVNSVHVQPYRFAAQGPCLLNDPSFPHREELLQFIWEQGLFNGTDLRTTDGHRVEVVRAGTRQFNSGPDLLDAVLRIDGQLWAGTVEVHVRSGEWNQHGHQRDPAYENVVLHVVWAHDADVFTLGGNKLPTVVLRERVPAQRLALFEGLLRSRGWVPCAGALEAVPRSSVDQCLQQALVVRMARRTEAIAALHTRLGHDLLNTTYHAVLCAFGGMVNAEACSMLAHALPVRTLLKYRDDEVRLDALLFGQAGMLQVDMVDDHPRLLHREYSVLARLHGLSSVPLAAWKFGRLRPSAFPSIRLAQFARFFARYGDRLVATVMEGDVRELREHFAVCAGPYWSDRFRFDQPSAAEPKRMGDEAVDHVLINAVVPLRSAQLRSLGVPVDGEAALELLRSLPAERNATVRGWVKAGIRVRDAAGSQALLELKRSQCRQRACLTCVIGRQLLIRSMP